MAYNLTVGQDYEVLLAGCRLVRAKAKGSGIGTSWSPESFALPKGAIITFTGNHKSILAGSVLMPFFVIESSGRGPDAGSDMGGVVSFEGYFEPNKWGGIPFGYVREWEA